MIDSYVTKTFDSYYIDNVVKRADYFMDRKPGVERKTSIFRRDMNGNIEIPENPVLSCEEVCRILKVSKEQEIW